MTEKRVPTTAKVQEMLGGAAGCASAEVKLPDPEAGDFATPSDVKVSSGLSGHILNQTTQVSGFDINVNNPRAAQKITLEEQTLGYVRFQLKKTGTPTGTAYCRVRKVSDDSIIETSATTLDVSTLIGDYAWKEFTLTCSPDEAVRICIEFDGGDAGNKIWAGYADTDECDGILSQYTGAAWDDYPTADMTIILYASSIPGADLILNQTTEEAYNVLQIGDRIRVAQKITLTGKTLSYVRFYLMKTGSPTGTLYARVRRVSDDGIIETSATTLDVSTLTGAYQWKKFALTCAPDVAVYVSAEYDGGSGSDHVQIGISQSDLCDGILTLYAFGGPWEDQAAVDLTIILAAAGAAENLKDEDTNTYWVPDPSNEAGAWFKMDLGSLKFIGGCRFYWGSEAAYRPTEYKIYTSPDNSTWTEVIHETEAASASAWKEYNWYVRYVRYIKLIVTTHGTTGTKVYETDGYFKSSDEVLVSHGHGGLS